MKKRLYSIQAFFAAIAMLVAACADDNMPAGDGAECDPTPLTGIMAVMGSDSRAYVPLADPDYVGRKGFTNGDRLMFTKICRTDRPIGIYTYSGIEWVREDDSWNRDAQPGEADRIYWSDAMNGHTFTGYSLPQMPSGRTFRWNKVGDYYYGSLGNFDGADADSIDYTSRYVDSNIAPADSGSIKLRQDDVVLTHSTAKRAQPGGSIALVEFRHALSNVLIVVNINGFAASSDSEDTKSRVWDMVLHEQPVHYKWDMASDSVRPLEAADAAAVAAWDATKRLKACIFSPEGSNSGRYRQFTFSSLVVPTGNAGRDMRLTFKVTYPDPLRPNTESVTKTYEASLSGVRLYAGKRTQINIRLEHTNENMTVGAEYIDWEFTHSPDESSLTKKSTFLTSTLRSNVTIHSDAGLSADDATWLYTNPDDGKIYDIYGNDGESSGKAYTISTADQLLSFAYEVSERPDGTPDIFEGKYVKLDAAITMQPKLTTEPGDIDCVEWIGIGTPEKPFNGRFLGYSRQLNCLYGKPLFIATGEKAFIEYISLKNVLGINGGGAVVEKNGGILGACVIEGNIKGNEPYCGSITAHNLSTGHIMSCVHLGTAEGPDYVGGIAGRNEGHIVACYHSGPVAAYDASGTHTVSGTIVEDTGLSLGVYFNNDYVLSSDAAGRTSAQLKSRAFVNQINQDKIDYCDRADTGLSAAMIEHYKSDHDYVYRPAAYPLPK